MTDEEMAEEYKESRRLHGIPKERHLMVSQDKRLDELKQAYLAGLKAGKDMNVSTRWHKVADGDLPKCCDYGTRTSQHVLVRFKSGYVEICYFDFDLLGWFANGYPKQLRDVIAWCEIPKYTEE